MSDLTIRGSNPTATVFDGNQRDRVFDVLPGANLTLSGIMMRNGQTSDNGGGIANAGTMTLINSLVVENTAENRSSTPGPDSVGGGIYNMGTMTLIDTRVSDNNVFPSDLLSSAADGAGAGIYSSGTLVLIRTTVSQNRGKFGGGIYSSGTVHLSHTTISHNQASGWIGDGGDIYNTRTGTATLFESRIVDNGTTGRDGTFGGGILNQGRLLAINSTISTNTAGGGVDGGGEGGGIWNGDQAMLTLDGTTVNGNVAGSGHFNGGAGGGISNGGQLVLTNSTISGNRAEGERASEAGSTAGGIRNRGGQVSITNSTITGNTAAQPVEGAGRGAGIDTGGGTVTLRNTIVAGNTDSVGQEADCAGEVVSEGYNLVQATDGCTIKGEMSGNLLNVSAGLGPLQSNGGPTLTHILQLNSPAVDAGSPVGCPATDQRGVSRPRDGNGDGTFRCDIGAYEREGVKVLREQLYLPLVNRAR